MKHCVFQQNAFTTSSCEEWRNSVSEQKDLVVCPKPRRLRTLTNNTNDPFWPFRCHLSQQTDLSDSKAGNELLDIFLTKGGQVSSSPPFFCGSPPTRASNPLIQDARFGDEKVLSPISPLSIPVVSGSSSSSSSPSIKKGAGGGGCVRTKFGHSPAPVRIEGFDCRRDRRNCGIPAVA